MLIGGYAVKKTGIARFDWRDPYYIAVAFSLAVFPPDCHPRDPIPGAPRRTADSGADGDIVRLPPVLFQPIAADDVASTSPRWRSLQHAKLSLDFDPLEVPRDRFLVGGDAWAFYRDRKADPSAFGIGDIRARDS
jgi:hypothetical protein